MYCHPGVARTLQMVELFFWWVGMFFCVHLVVGPALPRMPGVQTSRQTARWSIISLPLPNGTGVPFSVDYFGPIAVTAHGNS